jgi:hypothetical protein
VQDVPKRLLAAVEVVLVCYRSYSLEDVEMKLILALTSIVLNLCQISTECVKV